MAERDETKGKTGMERRDLLKLGAAAAAGLAAGRLGAAETAPSKPPAPKAPAAPSGAHPSNPRTADAMPTRNLGRTGYRVGIFSLGGQAAIEKP
jgi:hypothetical protein